MKTYTFSQFDLYIDLSNIPNSGLGVFTKEFIPKDSLIDGYFGRYVEGLYGGEYYFKIDNYIGIDASEEPRCYMSFLNDASFVPKSKRGLRNFTKHNFTNNCKFEVDIENKKVKVYSTIDIHPGSELFISYGSDYWT
jgi:SET domain-containing protein